MANLLKNKDAKLKGLTVIRDQCQPVTSTITLAYLYRFLISFIRGMHMSRFNDLKTTLEKFEQLMSKSPDDKTALPEFINFLRGFLRVRDPKFSLPSAELMTIIKKEKSTIFHYLKLQAASNPSLELLTQLEMDHAKARERLADLRGKLE